MNNPYQPLLDAMQGASNSLDPALQEVVKPLVAEIAVNTINATRGSQYDTGLVFTLLATIAYIKELQAQPSIEQRIIDVNEVEEPLKALLSTEDTPDAAPLDSEAGKDSEAGDDSKAEELTTLIQDGIANLRQEIQTLAARLEEMDKDDREAAGSWSAEFNTMLQESQVSLHDALMLSIEGNSNSNTQEIATLLEQHYSNIKESIASQLIQQTAGNSEDEDEALSKTEFTKTISTVLNNIARLNQVLAPLPERIAEITELRGDIATQLAHSKGVVEKMETIPVMMETAVAKAVAEMQGVLREQAKELYKNGASTIKRTEYNDPEILPGNKGVTGALLANSTTKRVAIAVVVLVVIIIAAFMAFSKSTPSATTTSTTTTTATAPSTTPSTTQPTTTTKPAS